jgi:tetratricopeptide (TPR) repeat protein
MSFQSNLLTIQGSTQAVAKFVAVAVLSFGLGVSGQSAFASPPSDGVVQLQNQWADAMYKARGDAKEKQLEKLSDQARALVGTSPDDANALIWEGIVLGSYAGAKGGLGALGLVKEAKSAFEKAISLNAKALDGSAYTSLGSLYYQVPGWPLGFGDDAKAEDLLKKGLAINPNGIDPNYFYGDFLFRQGRYSESEAALNKALAAPARPGRELADEGRRGEIRDMLTKVKSKKG